MAGRAGRDKLARHRHKFQNRGRTVGLLFWQALPSGFVKTDAGGHGDIETFNRAEHRNADQNIAGFTCEATHALTFQPITSAVGPEKSPEYKSLSPSSVVPISQTPRSLRSRMVRARLVTVM